MSKLTQTYTMMLQVLFENIALHHNTIAQSTESGLRLLFIATLITLLLITYLLTFT